MELDNEIIKWLQNYGNNTKMCFVVGISGGIDSAVVSTLCAKTGIETHVITLPIHQNSEQVTLAENHIKWLETNYNNIISHKVDLSKIFDEFKTHFSKYDKELSWVNTKSRLRMVSLYQISSFYNGLVVGTGNKIEDFGVGFFTKYGDGGVDISPIADLTKSEVREIARKLLINEEILNAKPTDGLWEDGRTDEEQIGNTYEELEWAMNVLDNFDDKRLEIISNYINLNKINKHKMVPIPFFKKNNLYARS